MKKLKNIVNSLHTRTKRDYLSRMNDNKIECMVKAREYEYDFWDGDRRFGYGGYKYDGRWKPVAEMLIEQYGLTANSKILDVGCGKGFLIHEIKELLPGVEVHGFDISKYAVANAKEEVRPFIKQGKAEDKYDFPDKHFDLVISLTTLHNLKIFDLFASLEEIERVGREKYIVVESYTNEEELFDLQCWALTCEQFHRPEEWVWIFDKAGYTGDYEFIYF
jgi:ubiquinone/menaquinone biosynthesis C-methylase UbiE